MIGQVIRYLFTVRYRYQNQVDAERASLLLYTAWIVLVFALTLMISTISAALQSPITLRGERAFFPIVVLFPLVFYFIQHGRLDRASWLMMGLLLLPGGAMVILEFGSLQTMLIVFPLLAASFLLTWRGQLVTLLLVLGAGVYGALLQEQSVELGTDALISSRTLLSSDIAIYIAVACGMAALLYLFSNRLLSLISVAVFELNRLSQITTGISTGTADEQVDALINRTLEILANDLNYPFVRVHMLDAGGTALHMTHTRLAVEAPAKDARRLETGSALLEAAQSRNIVKVSAADAAIRRTHFLSGISTGLIIPLASTKEVFGLLDIQSTTGINERDEETIKLLALQLGAALAHLRLVDTLRQEVKDQQDIVLRQRDRLRQFEREDRQAILSAWGTYMRERGEALLGFDLDEKNMSMTPAAEVDESIRQALQNGEVVTQERGDIQRVSVPVLLRGQVLGAVAIDLPATRPLTRRQTEMIVSVVQRLALALDNKRLFEQSQAQAQRESKASEIASLLISSTSVETVLELAADSFNDALGAIQTHIRISGTPERISQPEETQ